MNSRNRLLLTGLGICLLMLLNAILGAVNFRNVVGELGKWGVYAGEYVVLVIWFAWGTGLLSGRLTMVTKLGIAWTFSSWVGYAIARPDRAFPLIGSEDFYYIFNVLPLAFVISSTPLLLFRKWWAFKCSEPERSTSHITLVFLLVPLIGSIAYTYSHCMYPEWNLFYSVVIGILLAFVSGICAPLLSLAILGKDIRFPFIFATVLIGIAPGMFVASQFPGMGPGASGVVSAHYESICGSTAAVSIATGVFFFWRKIGIRSAIMGN